MTVLRKLRLNPGQAAGLSFVVVYTAMAVAVLGLGLVAVVANGSPSLHERLHEIGLASSLWGRLAEAMAEAAHRTQPAGSVALDYLFSLFNLGLAGFLVWLRPRDRTALLLAVGMVGTSAVFNLQAYGVYEAMDTSGIVEPLHDGFQLTAAVAYIFALLLFPDGKLVPRWPAWANAMLYMPLISAAAVLALRVTGTSRTVALVMYFGLLTPVIGVSGQAYRSRRSPEPIERQQARLLFWALVPAVLVGLFVLSRQVQATAFEQYQGRPLDVVPVGVFRVFQPVFALIPVALFVGILRYRLWNIERVISRALLYGILAGFVTAVYVGVVVVLGGAIGSQGVNLWLSILATGVVAVAFQPVKDRVDRLANRLVYGRRATPYEVLSQMAVRMGEVLATDELLTHMAQALAEGTVAARSEIWLVVGSEVRLAATWPVEATTSREPIPLAAGGDLPAIPGATLSIAVCHHEERLGALAVTKPAGETLTPTEEKLLGDAAAQAGLVLRNVRLNAELLARLEELKASRQRLVASQDEARRRLERNLHDGAQQQLVALKVMASLAEQLAASGQPVDDILAQIREQAGDAVETLRELARGIYPPLLAAEGLAMALRGQATRVPFSLVVEAEGLGRYPQEVEAAVYFCCLEAFQNATKHAQASTVVVRLTTAPGELLFTVSDDGCGFDVQAMKRGAGCQNMTDRVEALGGTITIRSSVGGGTTIEGRLPVPTADAEVPEPGGVDRPAPAPLVV